MFKIKRQLGHEKREAKSKDKRQIYDIYLDEQVSSFAKNP